MARMKKQTIFFVADYPHVFTAVRSIIEANGFPVVCFDGVHSCLEELRYQKCDLLVADIRMPETGGVDLVREMKRIKPWLPILVITGYGDIATTVQAFKAGAAGVIEKPLKEQEFLAAVMDAFDPMTSGNRFLGRPLTPMEMRVLRLILDAYGNNEISHVLHRSIRTIEVHRCHIMDKLGVGNIVDLFKRSVQMGLTRVGTPRTAAEEPTELYSSPPKAGTS